MRVTVAIDIHAPSQDVWADIADLTSHAEWMGEVSEIRIVGERRTGIGTVLTVPTRVGPFRTEDWIIVTDWEDQRRIGVLHVGAVSGVGEFTLTGQGTTTRFCWDETLHLPWWLGGRLGESVASPILSWIWRGNLRRLSARFAAPESPLEAVRRS